MKTYPSISRDIRNITVYAFDKLDGSNIRAEWTKKNGFFKFGSKKRLIGTDQLFLNEAIDLINENFAEDLSRIFVKEKYQKAVSFFEFYGDSSFAGKHEEEKHEVSLIDVSPFKQGILLPRKFLDLFGHLKTAKLLYHGNCNSIFVEEVKKSELADMGFEGVVCKAAERKKKFSIPVMFKVKTDVWIHKLKTYCKGDERLFQQLL